MPFTVRFNNNAPRALRQFLSSSDVTKAMEGRGLHFVAAKQLKFTQKNENGLARSSEPEEGWFLTDFDDDAHFLAVPKTASSAQEHQFILKDCTKTLNYRDPRTRELIKFNEFTFC